MLPVAYVTLVAGVYLVSIDAQNGNGSSSSPTISLDNFNNNGTPSVPFPPAVATPSPGSSRTTPSPVDTPSLSRPVAENGNSNRTTGSPSKTPRRPRTGRSGAYVDVVFDGDHTVYTLNWTHIFSVVPISTVAMLWQEANVTEDLAVTLLKYADIYKVERIPLTVSTPARMLCNVSTLMRVVNDTRKDLRRDVSYAGNFGIPIEPLLEELLYYTTNIIGNEPRAHQIFYSLRAHTVYWSVSYLGGNYQIAGFITEDFVIMTLIKKEDAGSTRTMTLLFGLTEKLPILKGGIRYKDILVARNEMFSLVEIWTYSDSEHLSNYLDVDTDELFLDLTNRTVVDLVKKLQDTMVKLEVEGTCGHPPLDGSFVELVFGMLAAHFLVVVDLRSLGTTYARADCLLEEIRELTFLTGMFRACFGDPYMRGYTSSIIPRVAAAMAADAPVVGIASLEFGLQKTILGAFRLGIEVPTLRNASLVAASNVVASVYDRYVKNFTLGVRDRELLLNVYSVIEYMVGTGWKNENLLYVFLLATSMCSTLEVATIMNIFSSAKAYTLYETFTPCLMSLRFDFNIDKLVSEGMQTSAVSSRSKIRGATGLFNVLSYRHVEYSLTVMPAAACLPRRQGILVAVPLPEVTYLVTSSPLGVGLEYDAADTFLNSNVVITAVRSNCSRFPNEDRNPIPIPVVYNISGPRSRCVFCQTVLMSYDEVGGVQNVMYISGANVQGSLFADSAPFFDHDNLHTHYLLLMSNGTVLEIRGIYRQRVTNVLIFILFMVGFAFAAYFLYKIVSKFF